MKFFVVLGLFLAAHSSAQTLVDAEAKTPYIVANCKTPGTDLMGTLGLKLVEFSVEQSEKQITISATSSLSVCHLTVDTRNNKFLSWLAVNPFKGFYVQYFDDATSTIKSRPVFIDENKPYNRIELVAVSDTTEAPGKITKNKMHESLENSFSGSVTIDISDVVTKKEFQQIRTGKTVKKIIQLYQIGNFTTTINGEEQNFGDRGLSAQNVVLTFKK